MTNLDGFLDNSTTFSSSPKREGAFAKIETSTYEILKRFFSTPISVDIAPHISPKYNETITYDHSFVALSFFFELNQKCAQNNIHEAIEFTLDEFENYIEKRAFRQCDFIISKFDVNIYPDEILHGVLSSTIPIKKLTNSRKQLVDAFKNKLSIKIGMRNAAINTDGYY